MDKVTQQLWLTEIKKVMTEDVGHFDLVLTVCEDNIGDLVSCDYEHYDLCSASGGLTGEPATYDDFTEAVNRLYQALENDKTVLIHCHSGTSRSVAVSAAGLARYRGVGFEAALQTVEDVREEADPSERYQNYAEQYVSVHLPRVH
ncbi:protein-tyrosine phosphatase family protein [Halosimplex pelagicum]|jgi:protein-tyrosine phosphatase|uniref:protein-tyrosine-phosphatase n=1 Tax=Halosimplex pelagicum TaxID=869886 RepID=A0A7D5TGX5_9EURY|nr:dual specificity protein phosphatase [Halosimplex pelagicum]QLH82216.1 dual specificity protein phosphatase family protein [Halosimplex pelagicum]